MVVHIIHNGEGLGTGINIPDEQVISQIEVLNEDFRRMNADSINTPGIFKPLAADIEIEFALAKRDPEGLATDGIVRINGGRSVWEMVENYQLKKLSYWPAEDYLNIWVTNIEGVFLGYAQFPTTNTLPGLEDASLNRETDGIVIDYQAFGSIEKFPEAKLNNNFSHGRTSTHEIGHYFGLRHIWGDAVGCGTAITDYVADTPDQNDSYTGCPDENSDSCGSQDMFQNYMDYTDDVCMNLFTEGQKSRMRIVLDNSPRRESLKLSQGNVTPIIISNDLGLRRILVPEVVDCAAMAIPMIEIRNYGNNTISSAQIVFEVNGNVHQTMNIPLSLEPLEIDTIVFNEYTFGTNPAYTFEFTIEQVNNVSDSGTENNKILRTVERPETIFPPFNIDFDNIPVGWEINNPDGHITWQLYSAPNGEPNNKALGINFHDYENGEIDIFSSPAIDLTTAVLGVLTFDVAYARNSGSSSEGLLVTANSYCGDALMSSDTLFYKTGNDLSSAPPAGFPFFIPSGADDWRTEAIDLEKYLGTKVSLAFIGLNGYGNNLYLDNINIDVTKKTDVAISKVISPSPASCEPASLQFSVINNGTSPIGYLDITYQLDSTFEQNFVWEAEEPDSIQLGEVKILEFNLPPYDTGKHSLYITVAGPNHKLDVNQNDNFLRYEFYLNDNTDFIPIKENFENFSMSPWLITNSDNGITWDTVNTENGISLFLNSSLYESKDQRDWLISPILNFSTAQKAILSFDLAYSGNDQANDGLTVLGSTDCGSSYDVNLFEQFGSDLNTYNFSGAPGLADWRSVNIDIGQFLNKQEVRLAFVSTNNNGKNIYLDNIEMFVTENTIKGVNEIYPNPSDGIFKITFNLPKKETVNLIIYDTSGRIHFQHTFFNTLNQTYTFDLANKSGGIYLVKVIGESSSYVKRIMLHP